MKKKLNNKYTNSLIIAIGLFFLYLIGNLVSDYVNPHLIMDENTHVINESI